MLYHVTVGSRVFTVELAGGTARVDGVEIHNADLVRLPGTQVLHLIADGRSATVVAHRNDGTWDLHVGGWPVSAAVVDERTRAIRAMTGHTAATHGPKPVRAPMPGLIVRVEAAAGETLRAGQGVVVMEAMKMENELKAENDGVVSRVLVEPGQAVEKGAVLVEFEPT